MGDGLGLGDTLGDDDFDEGVTGEAFDDPRGLSVEFELLGSPGRARTGNDPPGARRVPMVDDDAEGYDLGLTDRRAAIGEGESEALASDDVLAGYSGSDASVGDSSRGGKSRETARLVISRTSSSS